MYLLQIDLRTTSTEPCLIPHPLEGASFSSLIGNEYIELEKKMKFWIAPDSPLKALFGMSIPLTPTGFFSEGERGSPREGL